MNQKRNLTVLSLASIMLIISLALAGCGPANVTPTTESAAPEAAESTTAEVTAAPAATEPPPAASGDCLVGNWKMTNFETYMDSVKQNITENTENDVIFTSGDFSGSATFAFNPDHTSSLTTDNFTQSFTMTMSASDSPIEIPITLIINGVSTADYTVEGDTITFSNQNEGDMLIAVDTMGSVTTMTQSMFGEPNTVKLYQYVCVDANTLSLKVIAVDDMDLAPLILTRE
ncbi:MAG: hypothetical protein C0410_04515 [Anaerolinea sp.]|nr:hypothetical protein [Anaerolinea sp.]